MKKKHYLKHVHRVSLLSVFILIPILSILFYFYQHGHVENKSIDTLTQILDEKSDQIENVIIQEKNNLKNLVEEEETIRVFSALKANSLSETDLKNAEDHFNEVQRQKNYRSMTLVKPTGEVLYSTLQNPMLERGLQVNKQNYPFLWDLLDTSITVLSITLSSFDYNPSTKQLLAFFAIPVFDKEKLLGILIAEMDMASIYRFLNDYRYLGDTGDYVLAVQDGDNVIIKNPTRLDPDSIRKKIRLGDPLAIGLQKAVFGNIGAGKILDFTGREAFAAWRYLPNAQLAFEVKISTHEAYYPIYKLGYILVFLNALLIILFMSLLYFDLRQTYQTEIKDWFFKRKGRILKGLSIFLGAFFGLLCLGFIMRYMIIQTQREHQINQNLRFQVSYTAEQLEQLTSKIKLLGNSLAGDISSGRLKKEDIELRLRRNLIEYPEIEGIGVAFEPYAYQADKRLYAPFYFRNQESIELKRIEESYDYTNPNLQMGSQASWFTDTLKTGSKWSEPFTLPINNLSVVSYSVAFYDATHGHTPTGVVTVFLNLKQLPKIIPLLGFEKNGYGFISTVEGQLIYYPVFEYVQQEKTVFQVAIERNEPILKTYGFDISKMESGEVKNNEDNLLSATDLYFQRIKEPNWVFAFNVSEEKTTSEIIAQQKILEWIIFTGIFALIFLILVITDVATGNLRLLTTASMSISLVFIVALILLWKIIYSQPGLVSKESMMVLDQIGVERIIEENSSDPTILDKLKFVPTGIFIRSLQTGESDFVKVSGYCWQWYPLNEKIPSGLFFPKANEQSFREIYRTADNEYQMVMWDFSANVWQPRELWQFPFDAQTISFEIESNVLNRKLLFIPDFSAYQVINPSRLPGIDESLAKTKRIKKSYFSYQKESHVVSLDMSETAALTNDFKLTFNMVMQRDVVAAFMLYLLPLSVILACIFMVLITSSRMKLDGIISSYTVLLFGLIISHRELRSKLISESIVYLEYFFIIAYVIIFLMIFNAYLLLSKQGAGLIKYHHNIIVKDLYWPVIFAACFLVTFIIFYQ